MVRLRKGFWFFLSLLLAYLSSPANLAAKSINMDNLPSNQDMAVVDEEYDEGEKTLGVTDDGGDCIGSECLESLNETAKCNKCVSLNNKCPGCCLKEDEDTGEQEVRCPEENSDGTHICGVSSFYETDCELEDCESKGLATDYYDNDNCKMKCGNYKSYKSGSKCDGEKGTGGELKDDTKRPYGLERAGCPDEDSELLAPDNDGCTLASGSGLERVWKCPSDWIEPKFAKDYVKKALCVPNSGLTFTNSKPNSTWGYGDYYAVTEVSPSCGSDDTCSRSCTGSCKKTKKICAGQDCNPSDCTPDCPDDCSYSCVSGTACVSADTSTNDCICSGSQCSTPKCTPDCSSGCSSNGCSSECSSSCSPSTDDYYVYVLSDKYKEYIEECIDQADKYEKCDNEIDCCKDGVCPKKTDDEGCSPGFDANCDLDKCEQLVCYYSDCEKYIEDTKETSCAHLASAGHSCLTDKKICFAEIDPAVKYDFTAKKGDSLTIIWQIVTEVSNKDVEGVNFYSLVKVFELDADKNPDGDPVHTSMMNVKSLEADFTVYGTTNVKVDEEALEAGKSYGIRVYYFLPNAKFCSTGCETSCSAENEVDVRYLSLTMLKVRE